MERIILFILPLIFLVIGELTFPRRQLSLPRRVRWLGAGLLLVIGSVLTRLLVPAGLMGVALYAHAHQIGLFNLVAFPTTGAVLLGFILFDFAVWAQHVAMHKVDVLWRFHRVHHSDPDFDVFTALRFHPGELILSLAWKALIILALGVPAWAALWYAAILNLSAMFNHANLNLPLWLDPYLRKLLVTPDMHRIHHSADHREANRNFGFCLPWWDHLFDLYQDQPQTDHTEMQIGQSEWRSSEDQSLWSLLVQPRYRP